MIGYLPDLHELGPGLPAVRIGVVDGTPDLAIPALAGAALELEPTMRIAEAHGPDPHGTEICSLLFGRDMGLAEGCSGLVLPVFFPDPRPSHQAPRASQTDIARALYMAVERGAAIVNVSAGQLSATAEASRHLEDALALCERRGVLVVAAAGNDGCACLHVPAAVASVLAVGAMDAAGRPSATSNFGASYMANGILAPGDGIEVATLGDERVRRSGSSFATAVVAAVAARLLSAARRAGADLGPLDIRTILIETARPCDPQADGECARILAGRLDVAAAIARLHRMLQPEAAGAFAPSDIADDHEGSEPMIREQMSVQPSAAALPPAGRPASFDAVVQSDCGCGRSGDRSRRFSGRRGARRGPRPRSRPSGRAVGASTAPRAPGRTSGAPAVDARPVRRHPAGLRLRRFEGAAKGLRPRLGLVRFRQRGPLRRHRPADRGPGRGEHSLGAF